MKFATAAVVGAAAAVSAEKVVKATVEVSKYTQANAVADITPTGTLEVAYGGTRTYVEGTVTGLATDQCVSNTCGIHIHDGISCDNVGGHFANYGEDPWKLTNFTGVDTTSGEVEISVVADDATNSFVNTAGRTVLIHGEGSARQACGKIVPVGLGETIIAADLVAYPGLGDGQAKIGTGKLPLQLTLGETNDKLEIKSDAAITADLEFYTSSDCSGDAEATHTLNAINPVDGLVVVEDTKENILGAAENEYADMYIQLSTDTNVCSKLVTPPTFGGYVMASAVDGKVKLEGSVMGAAPSLAEGVGSHGFHVHAGENCTMDLGHLKLADAEETDPYLGWSYTSNANGLATASKTTTVNVEFSSIFKKPVVFHGPDGIKFACGVLSEIAATDAPVTVGPTETPTSDASSAVISAFAFGPALYAAYNAL